MIWEWQQVLQFLDADDLRVMASEHQVDAGRNGCVEVHYLFEVLAYDFVDEKGLIVIFRGVHSPIGSR